jgi:hypothetical protein
MREVRTCREHEVDRDAILRQVRIAYQPGMPADPVRQVDDRHRARLDPDDPAPPLRPHVRHDLAYEPDEVQRDNLERLPPVVVGEVRELAQRRAAGVVDEDVHAAETPGRRGDDAADALRGRQVGRDGEYLGARLAADLLGGRLQIRLGPGADRDPRALARQRQGRRLAEAFARRGNDRGPAVQPEIHAPGR